MKIKYKKGHKYKTKIPHRGKEFWELVDLLSDRSANPEENIWICKYKSHSKGCEYTDHICEETLNNYGKKQLGNNKKYFKKLKLAKKIVSEVFYPNGNKSHQDYVNQINLAGDICRVLMKR